MCKHGNEIDVRVKMPADLDRTGEEHWRVKPIDGCIAPIVKALQKAGINMRGSCCGHDKCEGEIHLQDGRTILILNKEFSNMFWKFTHHEATEPIRTVSILMKEDLARRGLED